MKLLILLLALFSVTHAHYHHRCPYYRVKKFTKAADNRHGLVGIDALFRRTLGDPDNESNPGPLKKGRRSINWDADVVPFKMPGNFFDVEVTRGALFKTRGDQFRVSNPPEGGDDRFDSIISRSVAATFQTFSPPRLFSPLLQNRFEMTYKIPAKNQKAVTSGYGVIFVDVDLAGKTKIEFFDQKGCKIGTVFAPPRNKGLSFAGLIVFDRYWKPLPVIAKAVVTTGNVSLKRFGKGHGHYSSYRRRFRDVVVMDDFIYGEPQPLKRYGGGGGGFY